MQLRILAANLLPWYLIVAIDGPAGSGKSTTARAVARHLGYFLLNSGAMYRAVALAFLRRGLSATAHEAAAALRALQIRVLCSSSDPLIYLDGEDITDRLQGPDVAQMASSLATRAEVRRLLVPRQREIGTMHRYAPGLVVDGRDIGTVVFPDAEVKIFMTAPAEVRARRRQAELGRAGHAASYDTVLGEIRMRDRRDTERALSPLVRADDAVELNTAERSLEEQVAFVVTLVKERTAIDHV